MRNELFLVINDLIGGWDLSYHNKPVSEHSRDEATVAWGVEPEFGKRVVELWNGTDIDTALDALARHGRSF